MLPSTKASSHQRDHSKKEQPSLAQGQLKLHQSENAWIPSCKVKETDKENSHDMEEILKRNLQSALNKLTFEKFEILLSQIRCLKVFTEEEMEIVADVIYKNAIYEPNFGKLYATLCKHIIISGETAFSEEWKSIMDILLAKCHKDFKKYCNNQPTKVGGTQDKGVIELSEDEFKRKSTRLANIRFIAELFIVKFIQMPVVMKYIELFLTNQDEESLECLYMFIRTAGKELVEYADSLEKEKVHEYFKQIQVIIQLNLTSTRMKFLLCDVLDLRNNNWVPRRTDNTPKTIKEIHEEAEAWYKNMFCFSEQSQPKTHANRNACLCKNEKPATANTKRNTSSSSRCESNTWEEARRILAAEYAKDRRSLAKKRALLRELEKKSSQAKCKNNTNNDSDSKPS